MKIVHISDTHGPKGHTKLEIPECDVLVHSGDIGGRTTLLELVEFLTWFEAQPGKKKIFCAGNHDLILDKKWVFSQKERGAGDLQCRIIEEEFRAALEIIQKFGVTYLNNRDYVYEGVKFFGSPYSPSFHRRNWAFNADRGEEISKEWSKIPSDVNVLITHSPPYKILDRVEDKFREADGEDLNIGCKDLYDIIKKRLFDLKLHCFGHIHDNYGVVLKSVSNTRRIYFSNGAVVTNQYEQLVTKPLIITI